ncbi:MAG TPA: AI-2E family transporter [Rhodanobacteraceae bacterium]|nr:AI-2E family transporter [Rhodanobacteraceae bacterium]
MPELPDEHETPRGGSPPAVPGAVAMPHARLHWVHYLRPHLLGLRVLLTTLLVLALLYTLFLTRTLMVPLVLAGFLGLGLNPLVVAAARLRIPRALTAFVVIACLAIGIGAGINALAPQAGNWLKKAPHVVHQLERKLRPVTHQIKEASQATQSLVATTGGSRASASPAPPAPGINVTDLLAITPKVIGFTLTVALLVFFFLMYGDRLLLKLVEVSPRFSMKRDVVRVVRNIQAEISRYIFTATCIHFTLGALTAGILYLWGMPDPLLWGGLAALANYMPYIGAICITGMLAVVGLVQFDHLAHALAPALSFAALSAIEGNVITPMIMGRHMRLSPVAILLWLIVWAWLWGIAGALLAVPMLTSVKLIAEHVRGWAWFAHIVGR